MIVWSEFFPKIILRYKSTGYFTESLIVFKDSIFFERTSLLSILTFFWKISNKMKKHRKNKSFGMESFYVYLVASKNNKLDICQTSPRIPPHKGLPSINIYRFQSKRVTYDHSHGMVCDNVHTFGTKVYVAMGNNVTEGSFSKIFP